ncbi:MerR family transcriptional regulator [Kribbella sp.]|uniref:MerR family transcriptional regulator n=1 Tax=Kribbella sp. TaxID=1871183 RepID=UPI002D252C26|nr:MerR family transcriptional regulator [Kribbella sp.]HZX07212.1 MerR family transcriptional regulator [Kribbella sp.]
MDTENRTWRVGALAEATGLSVRTLHHYDEIGLLRPGWRTTSGHRQYDAADVRRLHRIVALRGFGLSLAEIGQVLDGELTDPRALIRAQLEVVEEQLVAATQVRDKLLGVLDGLESAHEPSAQTLIELIEVTTAMNRTLTHEEFQAMAETRRRLTENLSPEELEALSARRQQAMEALTPEERERMRQARESLLPADG